MPDLPPIATVEEIHTRLQAIFPEGSPNRANCVWEIAARTVFVMLYVGAVEDRQLWIRPDQVTRMTDAQAALLEAEARQAWEKESRRSSKGEIPGRWYAVNTRESIRDDTLRSGLIANGAVLEREGLATTSPAPRYALQAAFAALFNPTLTTTAFSELAAKWQEAQLSAGALARITLRRRGAVADGEYVMVVFPGGETRRLAPGPSSEISRAVVEDFTARYLMEPSVIFLSESANKVVARDDELAKSIGLNIEAQKNLPDIILADLGPSNPILVFVEVVATAGPVTVERRAALLELTDAAGFSREHVAFVTAFLDRSEAAFKRNVDAIAWGSFVWFASEPDKLVAFFDGTEHAARRLADLNRPGNSGDRYV